MKKFKTIEISEYEKMLKEISTSKNIELDNYDLLIYGGGGQNKNFYAALKANPNYEVLWSGWAGPKWAKFLSFIGGESGLVRIVKQSSFYELYDELAAHSVSEAIYIKKELTEKLTEEVKNKIWRVNFDPFIVKEQNSFVITSEADETIWENKQEKYFYDYTLSTKIKQSLKKMITRENKNLR